MKNLAIKSLFSLLVTTSLLTSCMVEQNFYFNKDLSGNYNLIVDVSGMEEFAASDSMPTDSTFTSEDIRQFRELYGSVEGISNVDAIFEAGVLNANFSFTNLEALNRVNSQSLNGEGEEGNDMINVFNFTQTKTGIEIDIIRDFMGEESAEDPTTEEDIAAMDAMLSLSGNFTFELPVARFESEIGTFDAESNSISIYLTFSDIYNKEKNLKSVVVFK